MKISLYTYVRNTFKMDYHAIHMVKHHLDFFDEVVVHEGLSTDGTYEALLSLSQVSSKLKIVRSNWDLHEGLDFIRSFKDKARRACGGDWCVMLDADEFIPEWSFESLRSHLKRSNESLVACSLTNFYGNYRIYCTQPERFRWPALKMCIHRNIPGIEFVGGDSSSVNLQGSNFCLTGANVATDIHHFGFVRHPSRLRENWRNMRGRLYNAPKPRFIVPSWVFDLFPHNWDDPTIVPFLREYGGKIMKIVEENASEFVRDRFMLLKKITSDQATNRT